MQSVYCYDLQVFLISNRPNNWFGYDKFKVYVRKAHHYISGKVMDTFDVANVEVYEEFQRQGVFTEWFNCAEKEAHTYGFSAMYVENILNPHLEKFLAKRGYTRIGEPQLPSYYKMLT